MTSQILLIVGIIIYLVIAGLIAVFLVSDNKGILVSIIAGLLWGPLVIYGIADNIFFRP